MRLVARIAQSVEQGIENPRVLGSIPSPGTTFPFPFFMLSYEFLDVFKSISLNIDSFQKLLPYDLH